MTFCYDELTVAWKADTDTDSTSPADAKSLYDIGAQVHSAPSYTFLKPFSSHHPRPGSTTLPKTCHPLVSQPQNSGSKEDNIVQEHEGHGHATTSQMVLALSYSPVQTISGQHTFDNARDQDGILPNYDPPK
ncbi:hypothetical protein CVT26_007113 [Gymnopilus dilepis]|uniref:Uncharacterized protein n=1 Tax=Gymnopilus dilepis TaxID=231916 RepID=A0A409WQ69_9AGAR|nr:hypothetical protein CVT26_007113 [Gymnopilus dilepis]